MVLFRVLWKDWQIDRIWCYFRVFGIYVEIFYFQFYLMFQYCWPNMFYFVVITVIEGAVLRFWTKQEPLSMLWMTVEIPGLASYIWYYSVRPLQDRRTVEAFCGGFAIFTKVFGWELVHRWLEAMRLFMFQPLSIRQYFHGLNCSWLWICKCLSSYFVPISCYLLLSTFSLTV